MLNRRAFACILAVAATLALAPAASAAPVAEGHSGWLWGNPQPQGETLRQIEFSGSRGFAAGDFGTLVRTDDGGSTWTGLRAGLIEAVRLVDVVNSRHSRDRGRMCAAAKRSTAARASTGCRGRAAT